MNKVYIFGHRNPDTDSVTAAISLAYLKRKQGMNAVPTILSSINRETKYALNYFKVKEPMFLNDVKIKVKDLEYVKDFMSYEDASIYEVYNKMYTEEISKIPIVDKLKKLIGIVSMKDIASNAINNNHQKINSSYKNIIETLNGIKIIKQESTIKGELIILGDNLYNNADKLKLNSIVITNNNHTYIKESIKRNVKMIILTDNIDLEPEELELAKNNKVNIIKTKKTFFDTIKIISFCNNVSTITNTKIVDAVNENDDLSSFISSAERTKYTYYPITDNSNKCLGIVKFANVSYSHKKQVILVDHNSYEQSAVGLEEANIIEIVDHHNLSNIGTTHPISFRNMPLGSTNTIIYLMYKENNVRIPKDIAGLMLSGILSDTLILNSPTTTIIDKDAVNNLSRIAGVDYKKYGFDMISYGTELFGKTKEEILYNDFKRYPTNSGTIGLGQIYTTNISEIENEKEEYLNMLNKVSTINEYKFVALFVTDIIKNGTYVYYSKDAEEILKKAFDINIYEGYYLEGILSRKMQILPNILNIMN